MLNVTWIGSVGYKLRGQPSDALLDDALLASTGPICRLTRYRRTGMFLDYCESSIGADPTQELAVFLSKRLSTDWRVQFFLFKGFTDSGADWGTGLHVKRLLPALN